MSFGGGAFSFAAPGAAITSTAGAGQPSAFNFSNPSAVSSSVPAPTFSAQPTLSFGSGSTMPNFGAPAQQQQPGLTSFQPPASTPGTGLGLNFGGGLLGNPATSGTVGFQAPSQPAPINLKSTPASTASTGFQMPSLNLGGPPATSGISGFKVPSTLGSTPTTTSAAPTIGAVPPVLNFGAGATTTSAPTSLLGPPPGSTTTAPAISSTTTTTTQPTTAVTSAPGAPSTTTTTTTTTAGPLTQINFRQLQELINKWTIDLGEQEKLFIEQATKVNAWDKTVMSNGEKIASLDTAVSHVKNDHTKLEHTLEYLKTQQQEFEAFLEPLEASLPVNISAEPEREHLYALSENVDTELQQMAEDLKEIIRHINDSNKTLDKADPVAQILKILNEHTDALQWVEDNANGAKKTLDDVSKMHQMFRKDHERSLRMMFQH